MTVSWRLMWRGLVALCVSVPVTQGFMRVTCGHSHCSSPRTRTRSLAAAVGPGSYVALVTPMEEGGAIDFPALDALLEWHVASGSHGIVVLGTTGEAATIGRPERLAIIERAVASVDGRVPLMIGTGTYDTQNTIDQTLECMRAGADSALVVTPYYTKPPQSALIAHFEAVADAVVQDSKESGRDIMPIVLYNVPGRTGVDMKPETVAHLAKHPAIAGIKEASGKLDRLPSLRNIPEPGFLLYSGEDSQGRDWVLGGGDGVISVTANVAPREMARMIDASRAGDQQEAQILDTNLRLLHERLFIQSNPIPVKWALYDMGRIPSGILRLPLLPLEERFRDSVRQALTFVPQN